MTQDSLCLLVDIDHGSVASLWEKEAPAMEMPLPCVTVRGAQAAVDYLHQHEVIFLVLFASEYSPDVDRVIRLFQRKVGSVPEFQVVVCSEPSPNFLAAAFEFGIEQIVSLDSWMGDLPIYTQRAAALLQDKDAPEHVCVQAIRALARGDHSEFERLEKRLASSEGHHYLAAFTRGKILEAAGNHADSFKSYNKASRLNSLYRPALLAKGDALIAMGEYQKAAEQLEALQATNPQNVDCKLSLVTAYCELGKEDQAAILLSQAAKLNPSAPRLLEARVHYLLSTQQVKEALGLIDQLQDVGPNLASKLNDLGIRLSQAGKAKSALALYHKAHKIVRPELRYKVSLNSAIACRRGGDLASALRFCERAKQEFGGEHPKLKKIEDNIRAAISKRAG